MPRRHCILLMPDQPEPYRFEGFANPNTTSVPDAVFDELLLRVDNNELRVLLYIVRRTYGFKKDSDTISLSQMVSGLRRRDGSILDHGTGLSKASVARGLKGLIDKRIIVSRRNRSDVRGDQPTTYALRLKDEVNEPDGNEGEEQGDPCLSVETGGVSELNTPVSQSRDTQETVIQHTDLSNIRTAMPENETTTAVPVTATPRQTATDSMTYQATLVEQLQIPTAGQADSTAAVGRGGAPQAMADLLSRYRSRFPVKSVAERDELTAITASITAFAPEFGDTAPVKSSVTRAYNLYKQSGLALSAFIAELYSVRSSVKDIAQRRTIKNRMSYYFGLLEDRLGLAHDAAEIPAG